MGYGSHNFGIVPNVVEKKQQTIKAINDEPGSLSIACVSKDPKEVSNKSNVDIYRSPLSKRPRSELLNLPNDVTDETCIEMQSDDEAENDGEEEMLHLIPLVIERLKTPGQYNIWKKFNQMVVQDDFPMDNIAYMLFLDVVKWYASENTVTMRYDDTVSKFWRVGYKLFYGKFLRYISGPKHRGQLVHVY